MAVGLNGLPIGPKPLHRLKPKGELLKDKNSPSADLIHCFFIRFLAQRLAKKAPPILQIFSKKSPPNINFSTVQPIFTINIPINSA
jgi:hypothetical protein